MRWWKEHQGRGWPSRGRRLPRSHSHRPSKPWIGQTSQATVGEIFSSSRLPIGTKVHKYSPTQGGYSTSVFIGVAWSDPSLVIEAGEGFFLSFSSSGARAAGSTLQVIFTGTPVGETALPLA